MLALIRQKASDESDAIPNLGRSASQIEMKGKLEKHDMRPKINSENGEDLIRSLRPLAKELVKLQRQMKAMGLFTDDRDLVKCPRCPLEEDVTADGRLVTARAPLYEETGLQFKVLDRKKIRFQCPCCKCKFRASEGAFGSSGMASCEEEELLARSGKRSGRS